MDEYRSFGPRHYYYMVKPGGEIVSTDDVLEWGEWFESGVDDTGHIKPFYEGGRRVAWTELKTGDAVSTVFLSTDHGFGGGPPILFETMIRRGESYEEQWRYHNIVEARVGYINAVRFVCGEITEEEVQSEEVEVATLIIPGKCAELVKVSSDFLALLKQWEQDMHCPYCLADFLREHDLHEEAKAAEWAVNTPKRPTFRDPKKLAGVFPERDGADEWYWLVSDIAAKKLNINCADCLDQKNIPSVELRRFGYTPFLKTCTEALCWYLDNWREVT